MIPEGAWQVSEGIAGRKKKMSVLRNVLTTRTRLPFSSLHLLSRRHRHAVPAATAGEGRRFFASYVKPSSHATHRRGLHDIIELIKSQTDEFRFRPMMRGATVDLLFQHVPSATQQNLCWAALAVKSASYKRQDGRMYFHGPFHRSLAAGAVLIDTIHNNQLRVLSSDMLAAKPKARPGAREAISVRLGGTGVFDSIITSDDALPSVLKELFLAAPKHHTETDWLTVGASVRKTDQKRGMALAQIVSAIFEPLGLTYELYPSNTEDPSNLEVNGIPLVFRRTYGPEGTGKVAYSCNIWCRNHLSGGETRPLSADDRTEFVCIGLPEEALSLSGLFLFPRKVLIEHGVFASAEKPGSKFILVYPPHIQPPYKPGQDYQAWQLPYYIDLEDNSEPALSASREKFMRILKGSDVQ